MRGDQFKYKENNRKEQYLLQKHLNNKNESGFFANVQHSIYLSNFGRD